MGRNAEEGEISFGEKTYVKTNYEVTIPVNIKWKDNDNTKLHPTDDKIKEAFAVYAGGSGGTKLTDCLLEGSNNNYSVTVPVYVVKGTSDDDAETANDIKFTTEAGFYVIKYEGAIAGYTVTGTLAEEDSAACTVTTSIDMNEKQWSATSDSFTFTLDELVSPSFTLLWNDNNDKAKARPMDNSIKGKITLYYKLEGEGTYTKLTEEQVLDPSFLTPTITTTGSTTKCQFSNLPAKLKNADGIDKEVTYFIQTGDFEDYSRNNEKETYLSVNDTVTYTYAAAFTGYLEWRDEAGNKADGSNSYRPSDASGILALKVYQMVDGAVTEVGSSKYNLTWNTDSNPWQFTITGLDQYDATGKDIMYYVQLAESSFAGKEEASYKVTYDNKSNSTSTLQCYNEGTIVALLSADAAFSAKKEWLDDDDQEDKTRRGEAGATLYLWRYPVGGSTDTGAAVTRDGTQMSYSLSAETTQVITLANFLKTGETLPKYDENGTLYVYYATEVMNTGGLYRQVYKNADGVKTNALYEGGTLANVQTEKVNFSGTKQWLASGRTDYVGATVMLTLQRKSSDEDAVWENAVDDNGKEIQETIEGFNSSLVTRTVGFDVAERYDDNGKEYKYRVVETKIVTADGTEVSLDSSKYVWDNTNKTWSQSYTINGYPYTAQCEAASSNENAWTVKNSLTAKMKYTITKKWTDFPEGTNPASVTLTLNRNGQKYAVVTITKGDNDEVSAVITECADNALNKTVTVTESTGKDSVISWACAALELDEFDANGRAYVYSLTETETSIEGEDNAFYINYGYTYGTSTTDGKTVSTCNAVVNNVHRTQGDSEWITVKKEWQDNNETSRRKEVTVHVVIVDAEGKVKEDLGSTQGGNYEFKLNAGNGWIRYVRVDQNEKSVYDATKGESLKVVEYKIGDKETSLGEALDTLGTDAVTELKWEEGTGFTGTFEQPEQTAASGDSDQPDYTISITSETNKTFTITNRYERKIGFLVNKEWKDGDNGYNTRGTKLVVELTQIDSEGAEKVVGSAAWDLNEEAEFEEGLESKLVSKLITNSEETSKVFPLYDEEGNVYQYILKEYMVTKAGEIVEITTSKGKTEYTSTVTESVTQFADLPTDDMRRELSGADACITNSFTNAVTNKTGTKEFYVIWHDEAYEFRPDIYLTLYRKTAGSTLEPVQVQDPNLTVVTAEEVGEGNPYYQKAIFSDLELFDEEGNEYEYFVAQTLSNNKYTSKYYKLKEGSAADAKSAVTATDSSNKAITVEGKTYHHWTNNTETTEEITATGTTTFVPENGVIINTISDYIYVSGSKTWLGLTGTVSTDELPQAAIKLYRSSNYDTINSRETKNPYAETTLNENKDGYAFKKGVENKQFEKYDTYGALYDYQLEETITGTMGSESEAYLIPSDVMNYSTNNLALINTYQTSGSNSRSITVEKTWDLTNASTVNIKYPGAKFTLYRAAYDSKLVGEGDEKSISAEIDIAALKLTALPAEASKVDEMTLWAEESNYKRTDVFENLPIFAPNGKTYVYIVKEEQVFSPSYAIEITTEAEGDYVTKFSGSDDSQFAVVSNSDVKLSEGSNDKKVAFKNTYREDTILKITGTKTWVENVEGSRPNVGDGIKLTLLRYATEQTNGSNKIEEYEYDAGEINIEWTSKDDNTWSYTIEPKDGTTFPKYAPNGNYYTYQVKESYAVDSPAKDNYTSTVSTLTKSAKEATVADGETTKWKLSMGELKNTLKGSLYIKKKWGDNYDAYGIRTTSITVKLQKLVGDDWTDVKYGENGNRSENIIITSADKWEKTLTNLPVVDALGNSIQYRVIETQIGLESGTKIDIPAEKIIENETAGIWESEVDNYTVKHSEQFTLDGSARKSVQIENNLTSTTKLTVTKKWVGDYVETAETGGDSVGTVRYASRPDSITVMLQYREQDSNDAWIDMENAAGGKVIKTLTEAKDVSTTDDTGATWEIVFAYLPKTGKIGDDPSNVPLEYRAVEVEVETGEEGTQTIHVCEDRTPGLLDSYKVTSTSSYDPGAGNSTTTITNTLEKHKPITITKVWNVDLIDGGEENAVIEIYGYVNDIASATVVQTVTLTRSGTDPMTSVTLSHLPKYNANEEEITYFAKEISVDGSEVVENTGITKDSKYHVSYYVYGGSSLNPQTEGKATALNDNASTLCIMNTRLTTLNVEKNWEQDNNNAYLTRPDSITVKLQQQKGSDAWSNTITDIGDRESIEKPLAASLTANKNWKTSYTLLPLYAETGALAVEGGEVKLTQTKYSYRAVEKEQTFGTTPLNVVYTGEDTIESLTAEICGGYKIEHETKDATTTITNTLQTVDIKGTKEWADQSDAWNTRPSFNEEGQKLLTITLQQGGKEYKPGNKAPAITWTEDKFDKNKWNFEFTGVPEYKAGTGEKAVYTVAETTVPAGYIEDNTKGDGDNNYVITNTLDTFDLAVEKKWVGEPDENKPVSVTVQLQRRNGTNGTYEIVSKTEDSVEKDQEITLCADTGNEDKNWKGSFENLPKYYRNDDGSKGIWQYRVVETEVVRAGSLNEATFELSEAAKVTFPYTLGGYYVTSTDPVTGASPDSQAITITNTLQTIDVAVVKKFADTDNTTGRPEKVTFTLQRKLKGTETWATVTEGGSARTVVLSDADQVESDTTQWKKPAAFENLPRYALNNSGELVEYSYRAIETSVEYAGGISAPVNYKNDSQNDTSITGNPTGKIGSYTVGLFVSTSGQEDDAKRVTTATTTNTLQTTTKPVTVKWVNDKGYEADTRPTEITLHLQRRVTGTNDWSGDLTTKDITVYSESSVKEEYSHTFTNLLKFNEEGKEYEYRVVESVKDAGWVEIENKPVAGYETVYSGENSYKDGETITITNTLETVNISGTKKWEDEGNAWKLRPTEDASGQALVTIKLYRDNEVYAHAPEITWTSSADNTWEFAFKGVPKYQKGTDTEAVYTVAETKVPAGYKNDNTKGNGTGSYEITNNLETFDISVEKKWEGTASENKPVSITVQLQRRKSADEAYEVVSKTAGGVDTKQEIKLAASDIEMQNWKGSFKNLPKYYRKSDDSEGTWEYRVVEIEVVRENGNKNETIALKQDEALAATLPTTLAEYKVDVTEETSTENGSISSTITNTLRTTNVTVIKEFEDSANITGRPASVTFTLQRKLAGETEWKNVKSSTSEDWTVTLSSTDQENSAAEWKKENAFTNLPRYALNSSGELKEYSYRALETSVSYTIGESTKTKNVDYTDASTNENTYTTDAPKGKVGSYTVSVSSTPSPDNGVNAVTTTTVTNKLETTTKPVTVKWENEGNHAGETRPEKITLTLQRRVKGEADTAWKDDTSIREYSVEKDVAPSSGTVEYTHEFKNLLKYNEEGKEYEYRVVESVKSDSWVKTENKPVAGYTTQYDENYTGGENTTITNTLETVDITGTKKWEDESDAWELRPAYANAKDLVGITLYKGGESYANAPAIKWTAESADNWSFKFEKVPKYQKGTSTEEVYTVAETKVPDGYSASEATAGSTANSFEITNTLKTLDISVAKEWKPDGENEPDNENKPVSITVQLQRRKSTGSAYEVVSKKVSGVDTKQEIKLAADAVDEQNWKGSFKDLPKFYYDEAGAEKTWEYRVVEIKIEREKTGGNGTEVIELPSNKALLATLPQTLAGYVVKVETADPAEDGSIANTITNTLQTTNVTVIKKFDDVDNKNGRPTGVTFTLQRKLDGTDKWEVVMNNSTPEAARTVTLTVYDKNGANTAEWKKENAFTNLPRYALNSSGELKEYSYRAIETSVSYTVNSTPVVKNVDYTDSSDSNKDTSTTDTPQGKVGSYTVSVENETPQNNADAPAVVTTATTTNELVTTTKPVKVIWVNDKNYEAMTRPEKITLTLQRRVKGETDEKWADDATIANNGSTKITVYDSADSNQVLPEYSHTFENLLKYNEEGKEYEYRVVESVELEGWTSTAQKPVAGYTTEYSGTDTYLGGAEFTITNTLETITLSGEKKWEDENGNINHRPTAITLNVYEREDNGGTPMDTILDPQPQPRIALSAANNWKYEFSGLPKYVKGGTALRKYMVKEKPIANYEQDAAKSTPEGTRDASGNIVNADLTNKLMDYMSITGKVVWEDQTDKYGLRPDTEGSGAFTLTVTRVDEKELTNVYTLDWEKTAPNEWTYTISGLARYDSEGELLTYKVEQSTAAEYQAAYIDGYEFPTTGSATDYTVHNVKAVATGTEGVENVNFKNRLRTGYLAVSKEMKTGATAPAAAFAFTVTLTDKQGKEFPYAGDYKVYQSDQDWTSDIMASAEQKTAGTNGKVELKAGEKLLISDLPVGYGYKVEEEYFKYYKLDESASKYLTGTINEKTLTETGADTIATAKVVNDAAWEIGIENTTTNPADPAKTDAGGVVAVVVVPNGEPTEPNCDKLTNFQNAVAVIWKPDINWKNADSFTVVYKDTADAAGQTITVTGYLNPDGTVNEAALTELKDKYPDASLTANGDEITLTFANGVDAIMKDTLVRVKFLPGVAVYNATEEKKGGKVSAGGELNESSDGLIREDGHEAYYSTEIVAEADSGYQVDTSAITIAPLREPGTAMTGGSRAPASQTAAGSVLQIESSGRFTGTVQTIIAENTETVTVTGTAVMTRDGLGNVTKLTLELDEHTVPLEFGIPFIPAKQAEPVADGTGDADGADDGSGSSQSDDSAALAKPSAKALSSEDEQSGSASGLPATGDETPIEAVALVGVLCLIAGGGLLFTRRKKKNEK